MENKMIISSMILAIVILFGVYIMENEMNAYIEIVQHNLYVIEGEIRASSFSLQGKLNNLYAQNLAIQHKLDSFQNQSSVKLTELLPHFIATPVKIDGVYVIAPNCISISDLTSCGFGYKLRLQVINNTYSMYPLWSGKNPGTNFALEEPFSGTFEAGKIYEYVPQVPIPGTDGTVTVMHRCIYVSADGTSCLFKGDANDMPDMWLNDNGMVNKSQVLGKAVWAIQYVG